MAQSRGQGKNEEAPSGSAPVSGTILRPGLWLSVRIRPYCANDAPSHPIAAIRDRRHATTERTPAQKHFGRGEIPAPDKPTVFRSPSRSGCVQQHLLQRFVGFELVTIGSFLASDAIRRLRYGVETLRADLFITVQASAVATVSYTHLDVYKRQIIRATPRKAPLPTRTMGVSACNCSRSA